MSDELLVGTLVPLWLKIAWTVMVLAIVAIYWRHRGPANFLWFSDIAFLALVAGLWLESMFIVSLTACMVLIPEMLWSVSFFGRLLRLPNLTGIADYMFDQGTPLWLRAVSLFHVPLLAVLIWGPVATWLRSRGISVGGAHLVDRAAANALVDQTGTEHQSCVPVTGRCGRQPRNRSTHAGADDRGAVGAATTGPLAAVGDVWKLAPGRVNYRAF